MCKSFHNGTDDIFFYMHSTIKEVFSIAITMEARGGMHSNGSAKRMWNFSQFRRRRLLTWSCSFSTCCNFRDCVNVLVRLVSVKMRTASGSQVSLDTLTKTVATALFPIARYVLPFSFFLSVLSDSHPVLILEPQQIQQMRKFNQCNLRTFLFVGRLSPSK